MREFINANETIREDDYQTITAAIELAKEDGCRTVKIPRYNARTKKTLWSVMHAIQIPSDFTILLDNCSMEQAPGSYDHLFENEHAHDTAISNQKKNATKNIRLIGLGNVSLSGGAHNNLLEKTADHYGMGYIWWNQILFWHNVDGLHVENIHMEKQRHWAVLHVFCRNIYYKNIDFWSVAERPNMDGIDLRMGCHDAYFENITGCTGDDVFAMTDYRGVREMSCFVPGEMKDTFNIKVRNLKASSNNCFLARILNQDGNRAYNVEFDTLMDSADPNLGFRGGAAVSIGSPYYQIYYPADHGETYNITIKNVYTCGSSAFIINNTCKDTTISNVHTFGWNMNFLHSMPECCRLENVVFDHVYYGSDQQLNCEHPGVTREEYRGMITNFTQAVGDLTFKHMEFDPIRVGFRFRGGLTIYVEDFKLKEPLVVDQKLNHDADSKLYIDGIEQP